MLRSLSRRVSQHFDHIIGQAGLKTTQYSLLSSLASLGPVRPGALAAHMQMEPSTLTRNLKPLMAQGWVELGPGDDARSRLVALTEAGRAKRTQARREWKQAQDELNQRLGLERVAELHALLDDCLQRLTAPEGETDE